MFTRITAATEMDEAVGAQKSERTEERVGYRSGYYNRTLITRVGKLVLRCRRIGKACSGRKSSNGTNAEKALVGAMAEIYMQGVSTRKVKAITEELYGHEFSALTISRINKTLDEELEKFAQRRLEEAYL